MGGGDILRLIALLGSAMALGGFSHKPSPQATKTQSAQKFVNKKKEERVEAIIGMTLLGGT